ncbi:MAG: glycosyltransferase family 2 protein [Acidimicrobiales bacterium]
MIALSPPAAPKVSVLMLTYGAREWVQRSLAALVANTPACFELIILDNASPDGTGDWLEGHLAGATILRNPANVGFGPGVNQAALAARGDYLCLLNSDAMVEPGWLGPLLADLEHVAGCGVVVPRLLNLDGTLQEAGAVVGCNGATMALGYGGSPERPWHRFPLFVSYGSGACMLLRRSDFLALGGFDPIYGKGYYEDVDLCLRMAERGLRTVYEPRSVVRHVRGASSPSASVQGLLKENARRFRTRWATHLAGLPPLADLPSHPYRVLAARDAGAPDRVLIIGARQPRSADGRSARLAAAIIAAAGQARVTVIALEDPAPAEEAAWLLDAGVELIWGVGNWEDWMHRCRCHYSVAVLTDGWVAGRAMALLDAYQPQASVVLDVASPSMLTPYPLKVWDRAACVWLGAPEMAAVVAGLAPGIPTFSLPLTDGTAGGELARALATVGVLPTGPAGWGAT